MNSTLGYRQPRFAAVITASLFASLVHADVDYARDVKPVLRERCFACHGALKQKAKLRVDTAESSLRGGKSGAAIVPGASAKSLLIARVSASDPDERMPPEGEPLSTSEIEALRRWIDAGAIAPKGERPESDPKDHWAFQPLDLSTRSERAEDNVVDAVLGPKLPEGPEAAKPLLLRRVFLDLVGLPPSLEEQERFLTDDSPDAWTRLVDELISRPEHGERWGRHWMDIWRYTDWYGLGAQVRNSQKHIWRWRDWIVESVAGDKGYDRMLLEMLAADELYPLDRDAIRGTGFLARNYYLFNRTTWLDATLEHTSKALFGLTVNCAKCHDHKYDPISQLDYYRLRAIFEPHQIRIDAVPGQSDLEKDGMPRAFDAHTDVPTYLHVRGDAKNPDKSKTIEPGVPSVLSFAPLEIRALDLPPEAHTPALSEFALSNRIGQTDGKIAAARSARDAAVKELDGARKREQELPSEPRAAWLDLLAEPDESAPFIRDEFDRPEPELRRPGSAKGEYRDGFLVQSRGTKGTDLRYLENPPRNFIARLRFRTTGGGKWRSVGIHYDVDEAGKNRKFAYMSAVQPGSKVHAAYAKNGQSQYPPAGLQSRPVELNKIYELAIAVSGKMINVAVDGELAVAYEYPTERIDGFVELSAFDVTTEFHSFELRALPENVELFRADKDGKGKKLPLTVKDAEAALEKATKALKDAEALPQRIRETHASIRTRLAENPAAEIDAETRELLESLRASLKSPEGPDEKDASRRSPYPRTSTGRRTAFARWLIDRRHPLTARVAVHHVWLRHFGEPLVESVADFGRRAKRPEHADLLDALAVELIESGWSLKHLHRVITSSRAYRAAPSLGFRGAPLRIESQAIRDSLLALAGSLDRSLEGPPTDPAKAPDFKRRSLYFMHSRDQEDTFLKTFDNANILGCYRRSTSVLPQQTLALANSKVALEMARKIAERIQVEDAKSFVDTAFRTVLCRAPSESERTECLSALDSWRSLLQNRKHKDPAGRARANLIHALIQHHEFITIR